MECGAYRCPRKATNDSSSSSASRLCISPSSLSSTRVPPYLQQPYEESKATGCAALLLALLLSFACPFCSFLYRPPPAVVSYHHGAVPVSVLYYGAFSPHQKAVVSDFLLSLSPRSGGAGPPSGFGAPSVARWWETVDRYVHNAGKEPPSVLLASHVSDAACSLGKSLTLRQVERLAARLGVAPGGVAVVLTASDVAVEGFCTSACRSHGAAKPGGAAYASVGDSEEQCPGRCAWPFHSANGHRRGETLRAPNGDVGVDGMVINLAAMLAGAVTNPYGNGYFQGDARAPVEVAAACPGAYGHGAYPGYPGAVRKDAANGGGYNIVGRNGRKYLVPPLIDPDNYSCIIV